jgi:hypothetical protein
MAVAFAARMMRSDPAIAARRAGAAETINRAAWMVGVWTLRLTLIPAWFSRAERTVGDWMAWVGETGGIIAHPMPTKLTPCRKPPLGKRMLMGTWGNKRVRTNARSHLKGDSRM